MVIKKEFNGLFRCICVLLPKHAVIINKLSQEPSHRHLPPCLIQMIHSSLVKERASKNQHRVLISNLGFKSVKTVSERTCFCEELVFYMIPEGCQRGESEWRNRIHTYIIGGAFKGSR